MRGVGGNNIESMARTKQKLKDVLLERGQVSFPFSLRVADASRTGILLGGSELVAREDLRELAQGQPRQERTASWFFRFSSLRPPSLATVISSRQRSGPKPLSNESDSA
jgi:hypothetical protein